MGSGSPELVNSAPYGEGWLIKLKPRDAKAYDTFMTAAQYRSAIDL